MDQTLQIELVLDAECHGHRTHPDATGGRIADVDEVHPGLLKQTRGLDGSIDADRPRWIDLDRDDERAVGKLPGQAGRGSGVAGVRSLNTWGAWCCGRGGVPAVGVAAGVTGVSVSRWWGRDRTGTMLIRNEDVDCRAHSPGVFRRGATAAAHDSC